MKIKLISCEVFFRELCLATAKSPHIFELCFLPFGLHDTPEKLRERIQLEIDSAEDNGFDRIILGYGLCSRGTADIETRSIPVVMIKAHDCITALLGSRKRYDLQFRGEPGTYYYSAGWIERKDGVASQGGLDDVKAMASKDRYLEYVEKYGEDNAKYLLEQEASWESNYTRAAYINTSVGSPDIYRRFVRQIAMDRDWDFAELQGDMTMLNDLVMGNWESSDFLIVPSNHKIVESFDSDIIRAVAVHHEP